MRVDDPNRSPLIDWLDSAPHSIWDADPALRALIADTLGERFSVARPRLERAGELAMIIDRYARIAESPGHLPRLAGWDPLGRAYDEIDFDRASLEIGRRWWSSEVLSLRSEPGRNRVCGAIALLLDHNGEGGHACPVACTAGAIRALQQLGSEEQQERWLPVLLEPDFDRAARASQFVTEIQGGSDVGTNATRAVADPDRPGHYRIFGEKWFCSVADADVFVVSARTEDAADGTRGLGLFLVPRRLDGLTNDFHIRRLKDKLGTRGMATGEIEFDGALAEPLGPLDGGFANLVGIILDESRVHNGLSAAGAANRAWLEASRYAAHRKAFDQPLAAMPAVAALLARMRMRSLAAMATSLRILAMSDRIELGLGDERLAAARRLDVMINKFWTALQATAVIHDGIEVFGGNGVIEDFSVLPRLYRDAMVMESWEGPHNTLCAQILRDILARDLDHPWLDQVAAEIDDIGADSLRPVLAELRAHCAELRNVPLATAARRARPLVESMARLLDAVVLNRAAAADQAAGRSTGAAAAARLQHLLDLDDIDPLVNDELAELEACLTHP